MYSALLDGGLCVHSLRFSLAFARPESKLWASSFVVNRSGSEAFFCCDIFFREAWKDREGHWLQSFAIVTTEANELMAPIHLRMPVILHARMSCNKNRRA